MKVICSNCKKDLGVEILKRDSKIFKKAVCKSCAKKLSAKELKGREVIG